MSTYTRDDVKKASLDFFGGDEFAADVFTSKYALRDLNNNYYELTPKDSSVRIAKEFARIEQKYPNPLSVEEIYKNLMTVLTSHCSIQSNLDELVENTVDYGAIVPQGSPQAGIGNPFQLQSLSNCFVIPNPQDSYGGILYTDQQQAQIMKRRGGVGFDISNIRPKGVATTNAAKTTDGIGVFMERFSNTTREVAQGGRRGASMQCISIRHPEIETFINIKRDKSKVTGANISIKLTDDFMHAVETDSDFTLQWPVDVPLKQATMTKVVKAQDIWKQIIDAAWYSAEPGLLFWDTFIRETPSDCYNSKGFGTLAVNPCAEIGLDSGGACRLQVVNLQKFVKNAWTSTACFDFEAFDKTVQIAQRLLDDLVDLEIEAVQKIIDKVEQDPEHENIKAVELNLWKKIQDSGIATRRTGLGITAFADCLAMLGIKYGSQESIEMTDKIYKQLALSSYRSSVIMAEERGAFPIYDYELEKDHDFLNRIFNLDLELKAKYQKYGRRNIANTTTAPVGSLSTVLRCSSGIEPVFMLSYDRRRKINTDDHNSKVDFVDEMGDKWQQYKIYHHGVKNWMNATHLEDIKLSPYYGATSNDVDWETGIKIQATAQKWICHAISRTANLPKSATHEQVSNIYMNAWKAGCKGFTVYRDGSRSGVLLTGVEAQKWFDNINNDEITNMINIFEQYSSVMPSSYQTLIQEAKLELQKRLNGDRHIEDSLQNIINTQTLIHAPKRTKKLPCDIHRVKVMVNSESVTYLAFVGLLNNRPYEIFCGEAKYVDLPKKCEKGFLVKNGRKNPGNIATYNLHLPFADEELIIKDVVEQFDNPNYGSFSRVLSLVLRHNIELQYLVEQLQKDKYSDISSWSRAIARVLKQYIPDGTVPSDKKCQNGCGDTLIYQEGCVHCVVCGWSKC